MLTASAEVKTLTDVLDREVQVDVPVKRAILTFYYPDYIAATGAEHFKKRRRHFARVLGKIQSRQLGALYRENARIKRKLPMWVTSSAILSRWKRRCRSSRMYWLFRKYNMKRWRNNCHALQRRIFR